MRRLQTLILAGCLANAALAADRPPVASWSFDQGAAGDELRGFHKFVDGVAGKALRFDGQTTAVVRPAAKMPRIERGLFGRSLGRPPDLSLDLVRDRQPREGPPGRLLLRHRSRGTLRASDRRGRRLAGVPLGRPRLPLYAWNHLLGTFDPASGLKLYLNGKLVGEKAVSGTAPLRPRSRCLDRAQPDASRSHRGDPGRCARGVLVRRDHRRGPDLRCRPEPRRGRGRVLPRQAVRPRASRSPVLPSGPKGPGRFGAYYARLRYAEEWENPWRVGRRRRRRRPFRRDPQPARLLARHELYPRLGHGERHLVHQRILRDPGPGDGDERRAHGRQAGPLLARPHSREPRRPGRRPLAVRPGQRQLRPRQHRSADGLGGLGRGDLYRLPRRLVRPQDQGLVVQAAARSGRRQGME